MILDIETLIKLIQLGPAALLIVGGIYEWYVWGPTYRRAIADRDAWREIALRSLNVAEKK